MQRFTYNGFVPHAVTEKEQRYHDFYMKMAYEAAKLSYATRRIVGCLAVRDGNIIGFGFNGTPPGEPNACEDAEGITLPTVIHAEDNLLRKLAKDSYNTFAGRVNLHRCDVYVTKEPCKNCADLLKNTRGTKRLFYCEDSVSKPLEGIHRLYSELADDFEIFKMEKP